MQTHPSECSEIEGARGVQCRVVCMNCQRIMDRQIFQNQLSELNPGAYEAVERMVSTIRRNRQTAREARQRGMTPDGVQRPKFDAEVQKTGGPTVRHMFRNFCIVSRCTPSDMNYPENVTGPCSLPAHRDPTSFCWMSACEPCCLLSTARLWARSLQHQLGCMYAMVLLSPFIVWPLSCSHF